MTKITKTKLFFSIAIIFFGVFGLAKGSKAELKTYTTNFPLTENPISESGNWINGQTTGLDWKNVRTTANLAYGTGTSGYNDPTAILVGTWAPDQSATATVHSINQTSNDYQEVEFRLRSAISAHSNTGYEINFSCRPSGSNPYSEIVRWNGPLGDFTYLHQKSGAQYGVTEGDTVSATIVGNVINVYKNGLLINTATDNIYATGNPGIGFFGAQSTNFGFTSFSASDIGGSDTTPPAAPSGLSVM